MMPYTRMNVHVGGSQRLPRETCRWLPRKTCRLLLLAAGAESVQAGVTWLPSTAGQAHPKLEKERLTQSQYLLTWRREIWKGVGVLRRRGMLGCMTSKSGSNNTSWDPSNNTSFAQPAPPGPPTLRRGNRFPRADIVPWHLVRFERSMMH